MIELKEYQKKAIKRLKENVIDMLRIKENRQKLIFKAPTGSGKTVLSAAFASYIRYTLGLRVLVLDFDGDVRTFQLETES